MEPEITSNCYVYSLVHRETKRVFYIGRGTKRGECNHCTERFHHHMAVARKGSSLYVHRTIRSIINNGGNVDLQVINNSLSFQESIDLEIKMISSYGMDNLTNLTAGGEGCTWQKTASPQELLLWKTSVSNGRKDKKKVFFSKEGSKEHFEFDSLTSAAKYFSIDISAIQNALKRGHKVKKHRVSLVPIFVDKPGEFDELFS